MPKKGIDWMRYIPIAVMAVSLVSGYTMLRAEASNSSEKIKAMEVVQAKLSADSGEIRISQAKTETKMESIIELLKDIKNK